MVKSLFKLVGDMDEKNVQLTDRQVGLKACLNDNWNLLNLVCRADEAIDANDAKKLSKNLDENTHTL